MKIYQKLILSIIFSLSFVTAGISISPSTFLISTYPGEIISKNLTISSSANAQVFLFYTLRNQTTNIVISYTNPFNMSIGSLEITTDFKIPNDIYPGIYYADFKILTEQPDPIIIESHGGSGGCMTNYICGDWGECVNNIQTRECEKNDTLWGKLTQFCYAIKVETNRSCIIIEKEKIVEKIVNNTIETPIGISKTKLSLMIAGGIFALISAIITAILFNKISRKTAFKKKNEARTVENKVKNEARTVENKVKKRQKQ